MEKRIICFMHLWDMCLLACSLGAILMSCCISYKASQNPFLCWAREQRRRKWCWVTCGSYLFQWVYLSYPVSFAHIKLCYLKATEWFTVIENGGLIISHISYPPPHPCILTLQWQSYISRNVLIFFPGVMLYFFSLGNLSIKSLMGSTFLSSSS